MYCLSTFPSLCPLLLPKSYMSNVLRLCEILTNTSYLSIPKARRTCCAAGGAASFQDLSKKIFTKLLGNKGWMLRDCSSHTTFKHIAEFPSAPETKQHAVLPPTSPQSRPWWSSGMRSSSQSWNGQRSGSQKNIFVLYLLVCRHMEIQITLPASAPELTRCEHCGAGTPFCSGCPAHTQWVCRLRGCRHGCGGNWLFIQVNRWNLTCMLKGFHKLKPLWATAQRTTKD